MRRLIASVAALALLAACDGTPAAPSAAPDAPGALADGLITGDAWYAGAGPGAMPLRLFQQNVYPGFSIDAVEEAIYSGDEALAVQALTNGLLVFEYTDWRERAATIAAEVRRQQPQVITLNEMVTIERQGFRDVAPFLAGTPFEPLAPYWAQIPNGTVDFLPVFLEELDRLGLRYQVVARHDLTDITVPILADPVPVYARYADADVMLVRAGTGVANTTTHVYEVDLVTPIGLQTRGWIAADVTVAGKTWRVVATHPEPSWPVGAGETPQVEELLAALAGTTHPVLVAGDLNFLPGSPQYAAMTAAGYVDLWTERLGPAIAGETCCRAVETLDAPTDPLTERKDYVWVRPAAAYQVGPVKFVLFGDDLDERTPRGLWPSDHLGLPVGVVLQKAR